MSLPCLVALTLTGLLSPLQGSVMSVDCAGIGTNLRRYTAVQVQTLLISKQQRQQVLELPMGKAAIAPEKFCIL